MAATMAVSAADLASARELSQAVVDEYAVTAAGGRSAVGDGLRAVADLVDIAAPHIVPRLSHLAHNVRGVAEVQLRGHGDAVGAVLWAMGVLDSPVASLLSTARAVHVAVRGRFTGVVVEVVALAYGEDAAAIRDRVELGARPTEVGAALLVALADARAASLAGGRGRAGDES